MHAETPSAAIARTAAGVVSKVSCWFWVRSKDGAAQFVALAAFKHFPETAMDLKCPVWWQRHACMLRHQALLTCAQLHASYQRFLVGFGSGAKAARHRLLNWGRSSTSQKQLWIGSAQSGG